MKAKTCQRWCDKLRTAFVRGHGKFASHPDTVPHKLTENANKKSTVECCCTNFERFELNRKARPQQKGPSERIGRCANCSNRVKSSPLNAG